MSKSCVLNLQFVCKAYTNVCKIVREKIKLKSWRKKVGTPPPPSDFFAAFPPDFSSEDCLGFGNCRLEATTTAAAAPTPTCVKH